MVREFNGATRTSAEAHVSNGHSVLHIITGYGTGDGKLGSVPQPFLINMLIEQGIDRHMNPDN
jgi:hypothetical protein